MSVRQDISRCVVWDGWQWIHMKKRDIDATTRSAELDKGGLKREQCSYDSGG